MAFRISGGLNTPNPLSTPLISWVRKQGEMEKKISLKLVAMIMQHVTTERDRNVFYLPALCLQRVCYSAQWARSGTDRGRQKLWEKTSTLYGLCAINLNTPATSSLFNPLNAELNPICYLVALLVAHHILHVSKIRDRIYYEKYFNPLKAELIPICHLLALLEAHPIFHVSRIRVKCTVHKVAINRTDV